MLKLHVDDACAYRRLQRGVVLLGLIGVGECPFAHCLVEIISLAEIAADHKLRLARSIRSTKDADRVLATRMRPPGGMRITRYGVTQPLAASPAVCGRDW